MKHVKNVKKVILKPVAAVLSVIIALFGAAPAALAADPTPDAGYTSGVGAWNWTNAKVYEPGTATEIMDLFGEVTKNLVPGDVREFTVKLTNNDAAGQVTFALYAEVMSGDSADALSAYFPGKTASDDLLDLIQLEIKNFDGSVLYSGPMGGDGLPTTDSIYGSFNDRDGATVRRGKILGVVSAGSFGVLTIKLSVNENIGDAFQNALAAVEWTFLAEPYTAPVLPVNPPAAQPAAPEEPPTEIDENETPLAAAEPEPDRGTEPEPPLLDISDEDVPLADFEIIPPKTGDDSDILTWTALCIVSASVLVVWFIIAVVKKKREA
jgi:hypothetical protein